MKQFSDGTNDFYELYNTYSDDNLVSAYKTQCSQLKRARRDYIGYSKQSFGKSIEYDKVISCRLIVDCINFILKERNISPTQALISR